MTEGVLDEIVRRKRSDVRARLDGRSFDPAPTRRSLRWALGRPGARFLMEVKRASPSGHRSDVSVEGAVVAYAPVADAISVLTDGPFFSGSLDDLQRARFRFDGPILAKDFIIDPRQVAEARAHGADAVLAMLSVLDDAEAASVIAEARRLGMDVIVEVHDEIEIHRARVLGATIIGINNRDLKTLETDLSVTERLAPLVPENILLISESGVRNRADVKRLAPRVDALLVGSSLMASRDVGLAARSLVHGPIKICGLSRTEDVAAASEAGATHSGFVFAKDSPRRVDAGAAVLTRDAQARGLKTVGVFRNENHRTVAAIAERCGLDAVQLHRHAGGLEELRDALPSGCEIWSACGVGDQAEPATSGSDRSLFDTMLNGRSGGTGLSFDWRLVSGRPDLPAAFLAGGIGASNARAAQMVGTYGLDIGSAVESAPGRKDHDKLADLFSVLRPASRETVTCE